MDREHLDGRSLDRLLAGAIDGEAAEQRLFHLLVCETCRCALLEAHPEEGPLFLEQVFGDSQAWIHPKSHLARDPALQKEVLAAPRLIDELQPQTQARRLLLVQNLGRFQTVPVAVGCLGEAKCFSQEDPSQSLDWVEIAVRILSIVPPSRYLEKLVIDLRARAFASRGNALRHLADLDEAGEAFDEAWSWFWKGTATQVEWARLASMESSLRRDQHRFKEARSLLLDAMAILQELGERREEARLLVAQAFLEREEGNVALSVELLEEVLERFGRDELGRFLYFATLQNLAFGLPELGREAEARKLLPEVRQLARSFGDQLLVARVDWLEAKVCQSEGRLAEAEDLFRKVRSVFIQIGGANDAALASLELAVLYLETGRTPEVKELAAEMLPIFQSRQIHREAAVAGLVLIEALRREAATVETVRRVAACLQRGRSQKRSD